MTISEATDKRPDRVYKRHSAEPGLDRAPRGKSVCLANAITIEIDQLKFILNTLDCL